MTDKKTKIKEGENEGTQDSNTENPRWGLETTNEGIENLLKRIKALETDRDMLLQVADKKQLAVFYQRHAGKVPSRVMLRVMQGTSKTEREKVVVGWRTLKDEV